MESILFVVSCGKQSIHVQEERMRTEITDFNCLFLLVEDGMQRNVAVLGHRGVVWCGALS